MFHIGRCGSTVLGHMLDQHPDVIWANELFDSCMKTSVPSNGGSFVESKINESRSAVNSEYYGFETKYLPQQHLSQGCINMVLDEYLAQLIKLGFSKFILLHRENYLRRAISAKVGSVTSKWHTKFAVKSPVKISINTKAFRTGVGEDTLLELFRKLDYHYSKLKKLLVEKDYISISYEHDIMDDPFVAYNKISNYLGLDLHNPEIKFKRTNPFTLSQLLENYEDVYNELKDTKYEWMLTEELCASEVTR